MHFFSRDKAEGMSKKATMHLAVELAQEEKQTMELETIIIGEKLMSIDREAEQTRNTKRNVNKDYNFQKDSMRPQL